MFVTLLAAERCAGRTVSPFFTWMSKKQNISPLQSILSRCFCNRSISVNISQQIFASRPELFHMLSQSSFRPSSTSNNLTVRMFNSLSRHRYINPRHMRAVLSTLRLMSFSFHKKKKSTTNYTIAVMVAMLGLSFAGVPLYKIFCQTTGYGGTPQLDAGGDKIVSMTTVEDRSITIKFHADVASSMRWDFKPQQSQVVVVPGETALAFYTARNPTDTPIIGISSYNILPYAAAIYFNKIQCFCFEEQRLNPHEQVDMPVFFYIDPEFADDPLMDKVHTIFLSYTFFEAKEGFELPIPNFFRGHARQ